MAEINNLNVLTDKIYREGIEKAEKEAKIMLSEAQAERVRILEKAELRAKKIIDDAFNKANSKARSVEKELQLKGKQLISDLKVEIQNQLTEKILKEPVKEAFSDVSFIKTAVLEAIAGWKPADDLEVVLSKELENKLETSFQESIKAYAKNLTVTFDDQMQDGFRISEMSNAYQISFTEEDFIALFSTYLEEQTVKILFNTSS